MIKKSIKLLIILIVFLSMIYGIYKNPKMILEEKTQNQLLETADKLDKVFEEFWTGSLK